MIYVTIIIVAFLAFLAFTDWLEYKRGVVTLRRQNKNNIEKGEWKWK
jgi:hypothetical protein